MVHLYVQKPDITLHYFSTLTVTKTSQKKGHPPDPTRFRKKFPCFSFLLQRFQWWQNILSHVSAPVTSARNLYLYRPSLNLLEWQGITSRVLHHPHIDIYTYTHTYIHIYIYVYIYLTNARLSPMSKLVRWTFRDSRPVINYPDICVWYAARTQKRAKQRAKLASKSFPAHIEEEKKIFFFSKLKILYQPASFSALLLLTSHRISRVTDTFSRRICNIPCEELYHQIFIEVFLKAPKKSSSSFFARAEEKKKKRKLKTF